MCRPVRKNCRVLRFCCKEHQRRCQPIDSEKRGPHEGMTPPQVALLVDILLKNGAPWRFTSSRAKNAVYLAAKCNFELQGSHGARAAQPHVLTHD